MDVTPVLTSYGHFCCFRQGAENDHPKNIGILWFYGRPPSFLNHITHISESDIPQLSFGESFEQFSAFDRSVPSVIKNDRCMNIGIYNIMDIPVSLLLTLPLPPFYNSDFRFG